MIVIICYEGIAWKCPNTEFVLVRIFPHSDWIRRVTEYLSVFSPNAGKYGPENTPCFDALHTVRLLFKTVVHQITWMKKLNGKFDTYIKSSSSIDSFQFIKLSLEKYRYFTPMSGRYYEHFVNKIIIISWQTNCSINIVVKIT